MWIESFLALITQIMGLSCATSDPDHFTSTLELLMTEDYSVTVASNVTWKNRDIFQSY